MKKLFFIILLSLVLIPSTLAYEEKFNDIIYDRDTLVINDNSFNFRISSAQGSIIVTLNREGMIVQNGQCKDLGNTRVCIEDIYYDSLSEQASALIQIYYYAPEINITREFSENTVFTGEEIDVAASVLNDGDLDANNFLYVDYFPKEIQITSIIGDCAKGENNSVIYSGTLKKKNTISCRYVLTPQNPVDVKLKAQVKYNDGISEKDVYSSLASIKAISLFSFNAYQSRISALTNDTEYIDFDDADLEAGQKFKLVLNLTNTADTELDFSNLSIAFPSQMIIENTAIKQAEGRYLWDGTLAKNESKLFSFTALSSEGGSFEIIYDADVEYKEKALSFQKNKISYTIDESNLAFTSSLDNTTTFDSTKEMMLIFSAQNKNNYTEITDMNAKISFGGLLPEITLTPQTIKEKTTKRVYETRILAPNVSSSQKYKVTMEANYSTEYGTIKYLKKEWTLTVEDLSSIEVKKTLSKTTIYEGDEINITVTVKNTRNRKIYDVSMTEVFPQGIKRAGKTHEIFSIIEPGETKTAYTYTIYAPQVKNSTYYSINTSLTYNENMDEETVTESNSVSVNAPLQVKVEPKKLVLSITKSATETSVDQGENVKVKYSIENKDIETAHNINFLFSQSENIDILNDYSYFIERLDPGEVINFEKEVGRPKKPGKYKTGTAYIFFEDVDKNSFNYTIDTLTLDVKNRTLEGPAVIVSKSLSAAKVVEGNDVNVTITLENIGNDDAEVKVVTDSLEFYENIFSGSKKNFTYTIKARKSSLPSNVFAYYTYQNNEYRAYGKAPTLSVEEAPVAITPTETKETVADTTPQAVADDAQKQEEQKESFFSGIIRRIKAFFGA